MGNLTYYRKHRERINALRRERSKKRSSMALTGVHGLAMFHPDTVRAIRASSEKAVVLALLHGCSESSIHSIRARRRYSHID